MRTHIEVVVFVVIAVTEAASGAFGAEPHVPKPRCRAEIEAVLAKAPGPPSASGLGTLNIVLVADKKDHGPGEHDYPCWQKRWRLLLGGKQAGEFSATQVNLYGPPPAHGQQGSSAGVPKVNVATAWQFPSRQQLESADLVVMYCYRSGGARRTWSDERIKDLEAYLSRGGGFVPIHSATYTLRDVSQAESRRAIGLTGLAFDGSIRYRHGPMELKITARDHPICRGLPQTIHLFDEPYWPPVGDLSKVTVLATSDEIVKEGHAKERPKSNFPVPRPKREGRGEARPGKSGGHSPTDTKTKPQPILWAYRHGKGRVFGCVVGHYSWTFDDPYFRILLLRGMAWAAGQSPYRFDPLVVQGVPLSNRNKR